VSPNERPNFVSLGLRQGDSSPEGRDRLLSDIDHDRLLRAAVSSLLSAETVEVRIQHALVVADDLDAQDVAALAAVQRSLEVVRTLPGFLTALDASLAHRLGPVPEALIDERLVSARVLDAVELDRPDVVAVLQDRIDVGSRQWFSRLVGSSQCTHTSTFQLVSKLY
jgi:hypothetical protein